MSSSDSHTKNIFDILAQENEEQQLWAEVYLQQLPDEAEFSEMPLEDKREAVAELKSEVELLDEEKTMLVRYAEELHLTRSTFMGTRHVVGVGKGSTTAQGEMLEHGMEEALGNESSAIALPGVEHDLEASSVVEPSMTGTRRGQAYSRKSLHTGDTYVNLEDRVMILTKERERLRQENDRDERDGEHLRELLAATVEEALSRAKELRLEKLRFNREVIDEGAKTASADDLVRYMANRSKLQTNYLDKMNAQCAALEQRIIQSQQQLRQRNAAGEAFHAIDFEQLRIENQQFNERIERKNLELVELKGTSTRTVQTLNTLMDTLNGLMTEQNRLRKDFKSRREYLARLQREMISVTQEANLAERKNAAIKAQHEAVRVPKIEHYVAQKAEEYELKKADRNWQRKLEIADGKLRIVQQKIKVFTAATDPSEKRNWYKTGKTSMALSTSESSSSPAKPKRLTPGTSVYKVGGETIEVQAQCTPLVGSTKALLKAKRNS